MSRPTKQGIDYFPVDVNFDSKIELYILEKESVGLAVLITVWQLIYQNEGYYIDYTHDLPLLIKKRINADIDEIRSCLDLLLKRNVFDKAKYKKYKILTSKAVQKRFFEAAKRKKTVHFNVKYAITGVNVYKNLKNVYNNATKEEEEEEVKEEVKEKKKRKESFVRFWDLYAHKFAKDDCFAYWLGVKKLKNGRRITDEDIEKIFEVLPEYVVRTHKDGTFPSRKHPKTWLYNSCWNDELPETKIVDIEEYNKTVTF